MKIPPTRFGLVRHAQTLWNREKRIQGQGDSPLTAAGTRAAEHWGRVLKGAGWDLMLSSDLGRARATAQRINSALSLPLIFDRRLREQDWGAWVGKTVSGIAAEVPELLHAQERAGWRFEPPNGESREHLWERCSRCLAEAASRWPGKTILVVCHEGVIKCLVYRLLGRRFVPQEKPVLHRGSHLHWLACENGKLRLEVLNAIALDGAAPG